jgi:hypothetical protein
MFEELVELQGRATLDSLVVHYDTLEESYLC